MTDGRFKILVSDPIASEGIELLKNHADVDVKIGLTSHELKGIIKAYDALIVRSETRVSAEIIEAGERLQVVGRAGVGVDNIDLDAATDHGVAVVNAPTGNLLAAAEHTVALMLALARNVPQAGQSLKSGKWERGKFVGVELRNKTLGIIGLGKVGTELARRLHGFDMRLTAYDPFISPEYARNLGIELVSLERLIAESDFITIHTPLNENTYHLIGKKEFSSMRQGVRIINVARGGLIDEDALLEALDGGIVAGVALDVFATEPPGDSPLIKHPKAIVTPHLGASTLEAQRDVAIEVAEQVLAALRGEPASNTVNAPVIPPEVHAIIAPYLSAASLVGKILTQLVEGQFLSIEILYEGEIAQHDTAILKAAVLMGLLSQVSDERINLVNASLQASRRGLNVVERKSAQTEQYGNLITVTLNTAVTSMTLAGTAMRGEPHIVRVNEYWLDMVPTVPYLLFIEHRDRPGMIGAVGAITANHDINIGFMEVGRLTPRGPAMMILGLDDPIPPHVLEEFALVPHIDSAKPVKL